MALLVGLIGLSRQEGFDLCAVHVDHGLRADSGEDAAFVAAFCRKHGIRCAVQRVCCASASENDARKARYAAFAQVFDRERANVLALAHHRRDQAETVLLHLFRGSGLEGLSGMDELSISQEDENGRMRLWRPLLDVSPEELRSFLKEQETSWREDSTNRDDAYDRNFLRLKVLPLARERFPGAEEAMCRAAAILRQDHDCLDHTARRFLREHARTVSPCRFIDRRELLALHPALQARALRMAFPELLNFSHTQSLLAVKPGEKVNLPRGWRAEASETRLYFLPPSAERFPIGSLAVCSCTGGTGDGIRSQAIPGAEMPDNLRLRYREPGDRIRPLGSAGEKSLQDFLVDRHVDRPLRDHLPLLCQGKRVYWVIGVGPGEEMRVNADEPRLMLTYMGTLPGEIILPDE